MMDKFEMALAIEKMSKRVDQILKERMYEGITLHAILEEIADKVEEATGERPVFGPLSLNTDVEIYFEELPTIKFDI
jgi:hypothetical protein